LTVDNFLNGEFMDESDDEEDIEDDGEVWNMAYLT